MPDNTRHAGAHSCCVRAAERLLFAYSVTGFNTDTQQTERGWVWQLLLGTTPDGWSTHYLQITYCPFCGVQLPDRPKLTIAKPF